MTLPPSRIRRPEPADLYAVVDLLNACDVAETGGPDTTPEDVENDWSMEGFDLRSDAWVAVSASGSLVGYAYVGDQLRTGELEGDFWVHPEHGEAALPGRLLTLVERRARELVRERAYGSGPTLSVFCITVNGPKRRTLHQRGFAAARTVYRMAVDLVDVPKPAPPLGIEMRAFHPGSDEEAMYETMFAAFADQGHRSLEPLGAWRARLIGHADFDASLWALAWEGDVPVGGVIAYDHGDLGWVKGLGVRPQWRRRGVGLALLLHALAALAGRGQRHVELGVDAEGATRPLRLYERAGMHVAFAYESYQKRLAEKQVSSL